MGKTFDYCNKCGMEDNAALIHCAVCSHPYHVRCVAPKLTVKSCDELIANENFHFYCDEHKNLCVHKLLNRISLLERKFRICLDPLSDISNELEKHQSDLIDSGYNKSEEPVQTNNIDILPVTTDSAAPETVMHQSFSNITLRRPSRKRQSESGATNHDSPKRRRDSQTLNLSSGSTLRDQERSPTRAPTLKCIKPQRAVFLSGFEQDTTIDDIQSYIDYYGRPQLKVSIRKMKFHVQSRSAVFVLNVGTDEILFNLLCNPDFWPSHANCREYDFFRSRRRPQQHPKMGTTQQI